MVLPMARPIAARGQPVRAVARLAGHRCGPARLPGAQRSAIRYGSGASTATMRWSFKSFSFISRPGSFLDPRGLFMVHRCWSQLRSVLWCNSGATMRLDFSGPHFGSLNGKRQSYVGGSARKLQAHCSTRAIHGPLPVPLITQAAQRPRRAHRAPEQPESVGGAAPLQRAIRAPRASGKHSALGDYSVINRW
jgi:hypothetical protein